MAFPKLVGILNITPDSFSDGGLYDDKDAVMNRVQQLIDDGADIIDIGAESTRPGATELTTEQEWERLDAVLADIINLTHQRDILCSLDTRHATNAKRAIELGIDWINDVSGLQSPKMIEAVKDSDCKLVMMHSLTIPADSKMIMDSKDVITDLTQWFDERMKQLDFHGINSERIIFDPGVGFGKTPQQSLSIIQQAERLKQKTNASLFIGHSRKSFLSLFTDKPSHKRDDLTLAFSAILAHQSVDYLRVHDVRRHQQLFKILA